MLYSKRASLITISSLRKLCIRYEFCSSTVTGCVKTLIALRAISTAAQKSDFQLSGAHQTDDSLGYQQNHDGYYRGQYSNPDSQKPVQSPEYVAHANTTTNREQNRPGLNQNWGYTGGMRNDHGGNFSGSYGNNNLGSSGKFSHGAGQIADAGHISLSGNGVQNNLFGYNGTVNGYHGQSNTIMQQNLVGDGFNNSRGYEKHPNAFVENHNVTQEPRKWLQPPNAYSSPRMFESQRNLNGNLTQNMGYFQPSPNDHYSRSNEMSQQYLGSGQHQQNLKDAQYPPHLNTVDRSTDASHQSSNANPDSGSADASNVAPHGTLEQLDYFCMEGKVKEAVEVLEFLEKQHIPVDLPQYLKLMSQCGEAKSLEEAKIVHKHALRHLSPLTVSTYNRILEMYFECGSVDDAVEVFNNMPERNLTTWDTMIMQLAKNGFAEDSLDLFTQFKMSGLKPDGQMFIGIFNACSMLGDIDEGMLHFQSMNKDYGIVPSLAHFVSVVDMIGSSGHLDEAFEFVEKMAVEPSVDVWETLMNLCRAHGNTELADRCAELVEQLDPSRLNDQSKSGLLPVKASDLNKEKEKKLASKNLLEVKSRVHEYRAGDTSHPENDKLYALLRGMKSQMKEAGYIPETKFVLHDIDQEGKEEALLSHSERLAVAYGLLSSSARSPIRVIKNLRVCGDCHNALKIISKLVGRELIMRDAKRFHHFKDGICSCRDYW
ncbi:putative tetratricopeptide-like helical domain, DYW domain-containing protein [Lupinus albus]|uniref:Putative tetratricopeptide-like helical domain, DYW domain-containing protein n=1 Tax=Lupinus albus TaxID=3870 RepID=A0A6A4QA08_LUPAL|nr:putative tetratricopeptide-like helical domain, DYW domain-containing protein [Lupinus albus]